MTKADDKIPEPVGYQLLVELYAPSDRTKGGIIVTSMTLEHDVNLTNLGRVVKMGAEAFTGRDMGEDRFPNGPWCAEGDTIMWRRYEDRRFSVGDTNYALIADDKVLARVPDMAAIKPVLTRADRR